MARFGKAATLMATAAISAGLGGGVIAVASATERPGMSPPPGSTPLARQPVAVAPAPTTTTPASTTTTPPTQESWPDFTFPQVPMPRRTEPTGTSVTVPGTSAWTDSGVACVKGRTLVVTATGAVRHNKTAEVGPQGDPNVTLRRYNVYGLGGLNHAALIGRLAADVTAIAEPFLVGQSHQLTCPVSAELFLGINDVGLANNSGSFAATIGLSTTTPTTAAPG